MQTVLLMLRKRIYTRLVRNLLKATDLMFALSCGAPETFLSCIDEAAHGANIILIGNGKRETTFVHSIILKKELNIFGSRNAFTKDFEELIDLVADGNADIIKNGKRRL